MTRHPAPVLMDVPAEAVDPTGGTQMRVRLDDDTVIEYRDRIAAGDDFPPIVVFQTGKTFRLADGFHRFRAYRLIGAKTIRAEVHVGTLGDAIEFAIGANKTNGLRRTNADKQMAVRAALAHERLRDMSDRAIAELVGVDHKTVSSMRRGEPSQLANFPSSEQPPNNTRVGRDGKARHLPRNDSRGSGEEQRIGSTRSVSPDPGTREPPAPIMAPRRAVLRAGEDIACPHCNGTGRITGGKQ